MEDNKSVVVFDKKEIVLVVIFFLVSLSVIFTLGVRMGKSIATQDSRFISEDLPLNPDEKSNINLRSALEEDVDGALKQSEGTDSVDKSKELIEESESNLKKELSKFAETNSDSTKSKPKSTETPSSLIGKFTIQLGSYNSLDDAKLFAEGFVVRGYEPIVNEVSVPGKGVWYRVSLGAFETIDEAKDYIKKEDSLFQGQDYLITDFR